MSVSGFGARFWEPRKIGDTAKGRWRVAGREHCRSFSVRVRADAFLGELKDAARAGQRFGEGTGLPMAATGRPRRRGGPGSRTPGSTQR